MPNKKPNALRYWMLAIVIGVSMVVGIVLYYNSLLINLQTSACNSLNEVMQQEKNNYYTRLTDDSIALRGYAALFSEFAGDKDRAVATMNLIMQSTKFEFVFFAGPDGLSMNNKEALSYVGDRDYFYEAMAGHTVISEPVKSKIRDANIIVVATPVQIKGEIAGVLMGSFNVDKLNALFLKSFDGYGYSYIVTNAGEIIAKTDSPYSMATQTNLFDSFQFGDFYKNDSYDTMRRNLVNGVGGHSQYRVGGEHRMMHYDKLGINDWNIFTIVNPKGIETSATRIVVETLLLTVGLVFVFAMLVLLNVMSRRRFNNALTNMAFVDDVTGCRSFGKFKLDAQKLLSAGNDRRYMLIKLDIAGFKLVNQIYSFEIGNQVLKALAQSLDEALDPSTDCFARIHADEFVLLVIVSDPEEPIKKKTRFDTCFADHCSLLVNDKLTVTQGRCLVEPGETDFVKLFEQANFAHRLAKDTPGKLLDFDGAVRERAIGEREMESHMEQALCDGEFQMFLQPKHRITDGKMMGAEAVTRWVLPDGTMRLPSEFIPLFEQNGFIKKLDVYIFQKACETLAGWIENGFEPIPISLNFSSLHLCNLILAEELGAIAQQYGVPCRLFELELTESAMPDNPDILFSWLESLHHAGFSFALDGFAPGYSTLRLLSTISVDTIKIDRKFLSQCKDMKRAETVISGVVETARQLGVRVVAEGIETDAQLELLSSLGCEIIQGFRYTEPMPVQQLEIRLMRELLLET